MISIGSLDFFPPQDLQVFNSLGSTRLYVLVARNELIGAPSAVYVGKSIELAGGGVALSHHAVQRWRCFGRRLEELRVCESVRQFTDRELVSHEARLIALLMPELNEERAANEADSWWTAFFGFSHNTPEGTL